MRISLHNLSLPRLALELPGSEQEPCVLTIEHLSDLSGAIARSGTRLHLEPLMVRELQVTGLEWQTTAGRIALGTPATLAGLTLAASVTMAGNRITAAAGTMTLDLADIENLTLIAAGRRLACDARLEHLRAELGQPGEECRDPGATSLEREQPAGQAAGVTTGAVAVRALAMRNLQTTLGNLLLRIGGVAIDDASISWQPAPAGEPAPVQVTARLDSVILLDVTITSPLIEIQVERIELTSGLVWDGREIRAGNAFISQVNVRTEDIAALAARRTTVSPEAAAQAAELATEDRSAPTNEPASEPANELASQPASQPAASPWPPVLDPFLLDRVSGQLAIDATITADISVLGRRRATHVFRVPIEQGILSYRRVEDGLAKLEDWVFGFAVRNGALVLERDLVVSRKDLIRWPLGPSELTLARDKKVRLRTLLGYEIPPDTGKSSIIEIREVVLGRIDISLFVAPAEQSVPSAISGITIAGLEISGSLRHPPDNEQLVAITATNLAAMIEDLEIAGMASLSGRISIDALTDTRLLFSGLTPRSLVNSLHGVHAADLRVRLF